MILAKVVHRVYTRRFSTFSGRARRREFWYFLFFFSGILSALVLVGTVAGALFAGDLLYQIAAFIPAILFTIANILPMSALIVRRLHDCELSGWWLLMALGFLMVPVIGWLGVAALLVVLARGGSPEDNDYGQRPRGFSRGEPRVVPG